MLNEFCGQLNDWTESGAELYLISSLPPVSFSLSVFLLLSASFLHYSSPLFIPFPTSSPTLNLLSSQPSHYSTRSLSLTSLVSLTSSQRVHGYKRLKNVYNYRRRKWDFRAFQTQNTHSDVADHAIVSRQFLYYRTFCNAITRAKKIMNLLELKPIWMHPIEMFHCFDELRDISCMPLTTKR